MLLTYYTLRALAAEWAADLPGAALADAYSQNRGELSLALAGPEAEWTLVALTRPELRLLFRNPSRGRARRNTADLFGPALGRRIEAVRTAERDRVLFIDLDGGLRLQVQLFGPRPNVWLVEGGEVTEAFQQSAEWDGEAPPPPRAAPAVADFAAFERRWRADRNTVEAAVAAAMPLFDRALAAEAVHRAGVEAERPADCTEPERRALFVAAQALEREIGEAQPRIYWRGGRAEAFALVPLRHLAGQDLREEPFGTVDEAVRVYSRRQLAQERFDRRYRPLEAKLAALHTRLRRSADRMLEELAKESRAETYERYGHLLMAQATGQPAGAEEVTLPDLLADGEPVPIPLDAALTGVENAERYYDKARRTRAARAHAEARWEGVDADAEAAGALLERLRGTEHLPDLETLLEEEAAAIERLLGAEANDEEPLPYRKVPLPGGLEAWIGKHARGNQELTTRHARPHDLWLHARGVPGSHVVIRRAGKDAPVDRRAVEAAAALAAYFSAARRCGRVPVQVAGGEDVRPVKGGPAGLVRGV
ncbi:MAG: NFACT family protein, partial [Rhodothermales bacterium]|nr:NFACT family protein [Rhodothermales bacterium]